MSAEKQIDQMIALLRDRKSNIKKMQKLSSVSLMDLTPKQANKRNADADWLGMANIKIDHELHTLAVELGFAARRASYDEIELTDGWHRYKHKPREPFKDR
ncbi:hypothetical protein D3C77_643790 [compost metagenome]